MATLNLLDVIPRDSSNTRSPNRKPRTRRQRYDRRRAIELHHLKKSWLKLYRATGHVGLACELIDRLPNTVERWLTEDLAFREERDKIRAMWDELLNDEFRALGRQALEALEDLLDSPLTSDKVRFKAIQWILKSQGIGVEQPKAVAPHARPSGGPMTVTEVVVHRTPPP